MKSRKHGKTKIVSTSKKTGGKKSKTKTLSKTMTKKVHLGHRSKRIKR